MDCDNVISEYFFSLQNLKCLNIKKYTAHLPKLVSGHFHVVTRFSIEK